MMNIFSKSTILLALLFAWSFAVDAPADELADSIRALQAVGPEGVGNEKAAAAWERLVKADAEKLPEILAGFDGAGPLAANWLCTAVDAIAEGRLRQGGKLPTTELERFVLDRKHSPSGRLLAYQWLVKVDATASPRLLPGMLDDPCLALRREAVAAFVDAADARLGKDRPVEMVAALRQALAASRDLDQVRLLADRLKGLGEKVDLPRHFGFLIEWKVIGPFDNTGGKGYASTYPPEEKIDLAASSEGKEGAVRWADYKSADDFGVVNLNQACGEKKGVVAYATAEFQSKQEQPAELRYATSGAVKVWLNGKLLDQHHVYHSGSGFDQFVARGVLQPGRNVIVVKVCQNEQTQDWARSWQFQLRVCDPHGTSVLSTDRRS